MSQSEVAAILDITYQQFQKYEKGTNRIGAGRMFEIARLFNLPVQALFPDSTDPSEASGDSAMRLASIAEFVRTREGAQLCRAFYLIKDPVARKKIIALVEEIAGT